MATSSVKVAGLKELKAALLELPTLVEAKIIRGSLRAGQKIMLDAAKAKVTANGSVDSGALLKSIKIKFNNKSKKFGWIRSYVNAGDKVAWYARLIEFGTGSFYAGTGTGSTRAPYEIKPATKDALFFGNTVTESVIHPGIKPRPFMRPTFDAMNEQSLEAMAAYIRKQLPREIKKLARTAK